VYKTNEHRCCIKVLTIHIPHIRCCNADIPPPVSDCCSPEDTGDEVTSIGISATEVIAEEATVALERESTVDQSPVDVNLRWFTGRKS